MNAKLNLPAARKALEDERARLMRRIAGDKRVLSQSAGGTPDPADRAQMAASRERRSVLLAHTKQRLEQVGVALRRLDEGTYGLCAICNREINPERLSAVPYAITCITCQRQQERAGGLG